MFSQDRFRIHVEYLLPDGLLNAVTHRSRIQAHTGVRTRGRKHIRGQIPIRGSALHAQRHYFKALFAQMPTATGLTAEEWQLFDAYLFEDYKIALKAERRKTTRHFARSANKSRTMQMPIFANSKVKYIKPDARNHPHYQRQSRFPKFDQRARYRTLSHI